MESSKRTNYNWFVWSEFFLVLLVFLPGDWGQFPVHKLQLVWMVGILALTSNSASLFSRSLGTITSTPTTIGQYGWDSSSDFQSSSLLSSCLVTISTVPTAIGLCGRDSSTDFNFRKAFFAGHCRLFQAHQQQFVWMVRVLLVISSSNSFFNSPWGLFQAHQLHLASMDRILPLISSSASQFSGSLGTIPSAPTIIGLDGRDSSSDSKSSSFFHVLVENSKRTNYNWFVWSEFFL